MAVIGGLHRLSLKLRQILTPVKSHEEKLAMRSVAVSAPTASRAYALREPDVSGRSRLDIHSTPSAIGLSTGAVEQVTFSAHRSNCCSDMFADPLTSVRYGSWPAKITCTGFPNAHPCESFHAAIPTVRPRQCGCARPQTR